MRRRKHYPLTAISSKKIRDFVQTLGVLALFFFLLAMLKDDTGRTLLVVCLVGGAGGYGWYRWVYTPSRNRFHGQTLGELLVLTPVQFESAVGDILRRNGYRSVKRVGKSGDLSADLWCRDHKGRSVVVQCKRYSPGSRIGSRDIQEFIGMMTVHHRAERGIFVTTSEFTQPAISLARRHGIMLVDGRGLTRLISRGERATEVAVDEVQSAEEVGSRS